MTRPSAFASVLRMKVIFLAAMDTLTPERRSALMSRVRSKNTKPEMIVRRLLFGLGYRYRLHVKALPGTPDLVFPSRKKVILAHGCFWHAHHCRYGRAPKSRKDFWDAKRIGNVRRDRAAKRELNRLGWSVRTVWECQLRRGTRDTEKRLVAFLGPRLASIRKRRRPS
jgi:DNA mismatch endonuclease (patch repair protein)